jgi:hypothetical protein
LLDGTNVVTVTAQDAAGNKGTDTLTVTYSAPDTTAPVVTITTPTTSSSFATTATSLSLGGTASDNVGVTQISWTNDRGGAGTASGTSSWSAASIPLQLGTNIITVAARDASGNQAMDVLTVSYSAPAPSTTPIALTGSLYKGGKWTRASLRWSTVGARWMDVYRNGTWVTRTANDGSHVDTPRGEAPYTYKVCVSETNICSNTITLSWN